MKSVLMCLILSAALISVLVVQAESAQRVALVEYFSNTA